MADLEPPRSYRLVQLGRRYRFELRAGTDGERVGSLRIRLLRSSEAEAEGERWLVKASSRISRVVARSAATGIETARLERADAGWRLVLADGSAFDWVQASDGWTLTSTFDGSLRATSVHRQGAWYAISAGYVLDPGWPSLREAHPVLLLCTLAQAFLRGRATAIAIRQL